MHFALPTEEQWEFAAAGGSEGYNPDGSRKYKFSGTNDTAQLRNYANYNYNNSPGKTIAVKSKLRNQLGLYDMSGNVWEWCKNLLYDYPPGSRIYTSGVLRGGGYGGNANGCRVAFRSANNHDAGGGVYGFRLALVQE